MNEKSLQETFAPNSICFGCGPANKKGLRIASFERDGEYFLQWLAKEQHQAFPGMLNGGIIGSLLDCHSNWAAAHFLMKKNGRSEPECTVTANYSIKLLRPTPTDALIEVRSWIVEAKKDRATVDGELSANGKVCATSNGLFVAVKEGHPAYHRWG